MELVGEKIYYDPDFQCHIPKEAMELEKKNILKLFEYSKKDNEIDSINFHVNLCNISYPSIYKNLSPRLMDIVYKLSDLFNGTLKNYTVGYRIKGKDIVGKSLYFYPTIWKKTRYGIKGVTNKELIKAELSDFSEFIGISNSDDFRKIYTFIDRIYKFKGISIDLDYKSFGYKIYGRLEADDFNDLIGESLYKDSVLLKREKPPILVAQRIKENKITGYNVYYLNDDV